MLLVLFPIIGLVLAVVWGVIARGFRKASIASLLITLAFPVTVAALRYEWWETTVISVIALLLVVRHAGNIRRLVRREEHDLVGGSAPPRHRPAA
jgi:glycerol-3-phosphate acyltransferase PlsY